MATMLESERKEWNKYKWIMGIITVVLFMLTYTSLVDTNLYMWQSKASGAFKVFGVLFYALSLAPVLFERRISRGLKNESLWFIFWIALVLAGILTSCGFNFSL